MSKSGISMLSKYLAAHCASDNIQIITIPPGGIERKQSKDFIKKYNIKNPTGRMGSPKDLLPALDFLLNEQNGYTNGENIVVDGGFTKW